MEKYLSKKSPVFKITGLIVVTIASFLFVALPIAQQLFVANDLRPATDDYCFFWHAEERSVIDFQRAVFENSSGRISTIGFINLSYRLGPGVVSILPILGWLLLLGGLTWFLREIRLWQNKKQGDYSAPLLAAGGTTSLAYLTLPNIYQDFYWGPGVVNYTMAMGVLFLAAGFLVRALRRPPQRIVDLWPLAITSLLASMFNEPQTIFFISILTLLLGFGYWQKPQNFSRRPLIVSLGAGLAGLLFSLSTPGARGRLESNTSEATLFDTITESLRAFVDTMQTSITWENVGLVVSVALLAGFVFPKLLPARRSSAMIILGAWFLGLSALFGTIFLNIFTSAIDLVPPRTLLMGYVLVNGALLLSALAAGSFLQSKIKNKQHLEVVLIGLSVFATWTLLTLLPIHVKDAKIFSAQLQARGQLYDERQIFVEANQDVSPLYVQSLGLRGGVGDLKGKHPHWVNDCFTRFNEAEDIRAYEEFRL